MDRLTIPPDWWKNAVIYQIYPKSFQDSNGDGIGDLPGILQRLDYLQWLGINGLLLSPFFQSPMRDNGYDISDYFSVDPIFGTMADFDNLVREAHRRNLRIIIDMVLNHTSDEHLWFQDSRRSVRSAHRDWYLWAEPDEFGKPPSDWISMFGGPAWTFDPPTEMYYYHSFSVHQPDLNYENPEVLSAVFEIIDFWKDRGIAGFRIDAATFMKKPQAYLYEPPKSFQKPIVVDVATNLPGTKELLRSLSSRMESPGRLFSVAETPGVPREDVSEFCGESGCFDTIFQFDLVDIDLKGNPKWTALTHPGPPDIRQAVEKMETAVGSTGRATLFIENHDLPRSWERYVPPGIEPLRGAKLMAGFYFFLKGVPFIYQGQEIGMTNIPLQSIVQYDDPASLFQYHLAREAGLSDEEAMRLVRGRSRDNARTPMQWSPETNGGFSSGLPWFPVNPNYRSVNTVSQKENEDSLLNYYRNLVALRSHARWESVLGEGAFEMLRTKEAAILSYRRFTERDSLVVIANFSDSPFEFPWDPENFCDIIFNSIGPVPISLSNPLYLESGQLIILEEIPGKERSGKGVEVPTAEGHY